MAVPEIIPITHEPDYRTDTIGTYACGQFFAAITYAFPEGFRFGEGWEDVKRLYVVLHRFDPEGNHTGSDIHYTGTYRKQQQQPDLPDSPANIAEALLAELLGSLPEREYRDIAIRPFQLLVDDVLFGLVVITKDYEDDCDRVELYPQGLGFGEPWDGDYST